MSYTVVNPATAPVQPDEVQVTLDTGQSVAVSYTATATAGNGKGIIATARQIDPKTGATINDPMGHPIQSSSSHTWSSVDIQTFGGDACVKDCMLVVLGEPPLCKYPSGAIAISQDANVLAAWSVRVAIANAASITQTAPAAIL